MGVLLLGYVYSIPSLAPFPRPLGRNKIGLHDEIFEPKPEKNASTNEFQLIPAPRGTGLVASPAVKRLLQLAGVEDAYTSSAGSTKTLENTLKATFVAVGNTYGFLTPNLWKETKLVRSPLDEFADVLREGKRY